MNIWVIVRLILLAFAFAPGALLENSEVLPKQLAYDLLW